MSNVKRKLKIYRISPQFRKVPNVAAVDGTSSRYLSTSTKEVSIGSQPVKFRRTHPVTKGSQCAEELKANVKPSKDVKDANTGRKALTDVTNVSLKTSRTTKLDESQPTRLAKPLARLSTGTLGKKDCLNFGRKTSVLPVIAQGKNVIASQSRNRAGNVSSTTDDRKLLISCRNKKVVVAPVQSRNSIRPTRKDPGACSLLPTSSSNSTSSLDKHADHESSSVSNNFVTKDSDETNDNRINDGMKPLPVISVKQSNRRRSFTALLLAKSFEGFSFINDEKKSLYSSANEMEVAEYADDIYLYYCISERQCPSLGNYMAIQTEITPNMRGVLINWLIEVHLKFQLMQESLYLMVSLLDQYLSQVQIQKKDMQLIGLTSLLLASKYEDYWHPKIKDLLSISVEYYTHREVILMEQTFLKKLRFHLNTPTPYVFMLRFLKAANSDTKLENLAFYLMELSLVEYEALQYKPSMLCASVIYIARATLKLYPAWTPLLAKHSFYDESDIRDCADMIWRFHKSVGRSNFKVSHDKFMRAERFCVAQIAPLRSFPLGCEKVRKK